jgi:hypothetical protein
MVEEPIMKMLPAVAVTGRVLTIRGMRPAKYFRSLMKPLFACSIFALILAAQSPKTHADTIYVNDFETSVDSGWSSVTRQALGINRTPSGRGFLGWASTTQALNGVSHEGLSLTTVVPRPGLIQVDFDLYLINSWDGNSSIFGPDIFQISLESDTPVFRATFANVAGLTQTYPDSLNDRGLTTNNPAKTGAREINTLSYLPFTVSGDAVYHFSFAVPVTDGAVNFSIQDVSNGAGLADESWGLDNMRVTTVPEPGSLLLFTTAIAFMAIRASIPVRKRPASSKRKDTANRVVPI